MFSVTFCKTTQNFSKVGIPEEQIKYKSIVPESKILLSSPILFSNLLSFNH